MTWSEVDFEAPCLNLKDSKTGKKTISVSDAAINLLKKIPRIEECNFVFPGASLDKPFQGLQKFWNGVRGVAGLSDVRLHDLRHTFASKAASGGVSFAVIGNLLGHKDPRTTQRYAHIAEDTAKKSCQSGSSCDITQGEYWAERTGCLEAVLGDFP